MSFIFYYRYLIEFVGLPAWGNYIIPMTLSGFKMPSFLNYYQYNSTLTVTPESAFLSYYFFSLPIIILSKFLPIFVSEKLYVFLSTIFFALSVYYLSGKIKKRSNIKLIVILKINVKKRRLLDPSLNSIKKYVNTIRYNNVPNTNG